MYGFKGCRWKALNQKWSDDAHRLEIPSSHSEAWDFFHLRFFLHWDIHWHDIGFAWLSQNVKSQGKIKRQEFHVHEVSQNMCLLARLCSFKTSSNKGANLSLQDITEQTRHSQHPISSISYACTRCLWKNDHINNENDWWERQALWNIFKHKFRDCRCVQSGRHAYSATGRSASQRGWLLRLPQQRLKHAALHRRMATVPLLVARSNLSYEKRELLQ